MTTFGNARNQSITGRFRVELSKSGGQSPELETIFSLFHSFTATEHEIGREFCTITVLQSTCVLVVVILPTKPIVKIIFGFGQFT